ncbi:MAG TPA: hydroxyacylglutathione hydrolase [Gammaproteobacteria bacterium]|nr:hydroxyacylglutathione hydrolase [Gammaproteobacteria bacterium]
MVSIHPIRALKDNYIWLLRSPKQYACVFDPGESAPVLTFLQKNKLKLLSILITHHHWDHVSGVLELLQHYPNITVYGPAHDAINGLNNPVSEPNEIYLPELELSFKVLSIPGHTLDHIAYYNNKFLFCGDTLFSAGCGRVFEGTMPQMLQSLEKLKALDGDILMFCAHEYTKKNLEFALTLEPENLAIKKRLCQVKEQLAQEKPSLPVRLREEKQTNPFLRCREAKLIQAVIKKDPRIDPKDPIAVFTALRKWKDTY